jgi:predicted AAA+ superfamily ATPase
MYIERDITKEVVKSLTPNKVVVLLGARRTGKTELLNHILSNSKETYLKLNGDDITTGSLLEYRTTENFKAVAGNNTLIAIDEAQKINDIGIKLKLMVDTIPGIKIITTGSSAFDLSGKLGEPLTGRKRTFYLYPFSQREYSAHENLTETKSRLKERMIFGCYPELYRFRDRKEKSLYLSELVSSYLLKDILEFEGIRNAKKILDLLKLVAYQIGKEVSLSELGNSLSLHKDTVAKYLDLLTKVFVLYRVDGFSRNLRKEITKMSRWYFYDNGVRNSIINNLNDLNLRNDQGDLWENYVLSERMKKQNFENMLVSNYFWRTYQKQEIDWIEEREGKIFAYEIKWSSRKKIKIPKTFSETYQGSEYEIITPDNYLQWIM